MLYPKGKVPGDIVYPSVLCLVRQFSLGKTVRGDSWYGRGGGGGGGGGGGMKLPVVIRRKTFYQSVIF